MSILVLAVELVDNLKIYTVAMMVIMIVGMLYISLCRLVLDLKLFLSQVRHEMVDVWVLVVMFEKEEKSKEKHLSKMLMVLFRVERLLLED